MKELVETLSAQMQTFLTDAKLQAERGNKAAGLRARKQSMAIEKGLKEFRKQSMAQSNGAAE